VVCVVYECSVCIGVADWCGLKMFKAHGRFSYYRERFTFSPALSKKKKRKGIFSAPLTKILILTNRILVNI